MSKAHCGCTFFHEYVVKINWVKHCLTSIRLFYCLLLDPISNWQIWTIPNGMSLFKYFLIVINVTDGLIKLSYSKLNILKIPMEDTEEENSSSSIPGSGNVVKMDSPSDLSFLRNEWHCFYSSKSQKIILFLNSFLKYDAASL